MKANVKRLAVYAHGPHFYRASDGTLMWEYVIDHGNQLGPRSATLADKEKYPDAYQAFEDEEANAVESDEGQEAGEAISEVGQGPQPVKKAKR